MSIKENKPIEYYGYAIPKKRYYSLDSILNYYNPKYLSSKYKKNMNDHDTNIKLITDIKNNLQINTAEQWENTPGLNLINLNKLDIYTPKKIIMKLANWASDSKKNKNNLKIPVKSHPKFTNIDTMYLHYHKTIPQYIIDKNKKIKKELEEQEKLEKQKHRHKQLHNKTKPNCPTNYELQNKLNYLQEQLEKQVKLNKTLIKHNESKSKQKIKTKKK